MNRSREDKELLKNIEDLLAGRETSLSGDASDNCRTAVDFARKLIEHRVEPSPAFAADLKQRLLAKQAALGAGTAREERKAGFWEFLGNIVPRGAVWQAAAATLLLIVMAAGVIWQTGVFSPVTAPAPEVLQNPQLGIMSNQPPVAATPPQTPATSKALGVARVAQAVTVVPDKPAYTAGEEVRLTVAFTNNDAQPVTYGNFPPSVQVVNNENGAVVRSFPAGEAALHLTPSEVKDHTITWDQKDESGTQVSPGQYEVVVQGGVEGTAGITSADSNASASIIIIQPAPGK